MLIFDDRPALFYPVSLTRSVGDLRCGILKLRQRWLELSDDDEDIIWVEPSLMELYRFRHPDWHLNTAPGCDTLWINSRLRYNEDSIYAVQNLKPHSALFSDGSLLAMRGGKALDALPGQDFLKQNGYEVIETGLPVYRCLSDIIHDNSRLLRHDFEAFFQDKDKLAEFEPGVSVLDPYNVWIGEGTRLAPGVVLDASEGPVVIDNGSTVMPNAVITGPCYIGRSCVVKIGAKIYPGTSIGPVCKIGGEVEGTIFQAYSNKQHDGFLGHSYVGEWVNIGADTNNSDLKNTYRNVAFHSYEAKAKVDSGTMFLGTAIGDHSKLGINCTVNTGAVIGCASSLWGSALIDGFIPDFSWGTADSLSPHRFDAFMQTASLVKGRRGLELSEQERDLYLRISRLHSGA
jgi:UDP-N-acetylglucosamine diphosphorylase/glucosamine-1-phosphate N-acetyltransferase